MRSSILIASVASFAGLASASVVTIQVTPLNFSVPSGQTWVELPAGFQARMRLSATVAPALSSGSQLSYLKFDFSASGITPTFVYAPLVYRGVIEPSSPNFWGPADINGDGVVSCRDYVPFSVGYWHLLADPCGLTSDLNNDFFVDDSDFVILAGRLSSVEAWRNASNGPYETARWSWSAGSGAVQLFDFTMNIPTTAGPGERYPIVATPLEVLIGTMVSGNPCDQIQLVPPTTVAAQLELRTPGQACTGDLNGDQQVDDSDFVKFAVAYNVLDCADGAMPAGCPADFNDDQFVDDSDFVLFASAYDALLCP